MRRTAPWQQRCRRVRQPDYHAGESETRFRGARRIESSGGRKAGRKRDERTKTKKREDVVDERRSGEAPNPRA
jgi:hypothetical protein